MTLNTERLNECMWIFTQFFTFGENDKIADIPINEIMPLLKKDLVDAMMRNEEKAQSIFWWLSNAYDYIIGDTDVLPSVEIEYVD